MDIFGFNKKFSEHKKMIDSAIADFKNDVIETIETKFLSIKNEIQTLIDDKINSHFEKNIEEMAFKLKQKQIEAIKNSDQPYVNIVADAYDEKNGSFNLILDWNDAFIKELRKAGFTGATDQEMVNLWLASLSREMK